MPSNIFTVPISLDTSTFTFNSNLSSAGWTTITAQPAYPTTENIAKTEQIAKKMGCVMVIPEKNQLFVDIDNVADYRTFKTVATQLSAYIKSWSEKPSKSGLPKRHITVVLNKEVDELERICLQAILGSDRRREAHSYIARIIGHEHPTVFFEKEGP